MNQPKLELERIFDEGFKFKRHESAKIDLYEKGTQRLRYNNQLDQEVSRYVVRIVNPRVAI